jgi:hypothetical protein
VVQPQKTALVFEALRMVVLAIPADMLGLRALLLIVCAAALRRSELVALEVGDPSFEREGTAREPLRSRSEIRFSSSTTSSTHAGAARANPIFGHPQTHF